MQSPLEATCCHITCTNKLVSQFCFPCSFISASSSTFRTLGSMIKIQRPQVQSLICSTLREKTSGYRSIHQYAGRKVKITAHMLSAVYAAGSVYILASFSPFFLFLPFPLPSSFLISRYIDVTSTFLKPLWNRHS